MGLGAPKQRKITSSDPNNTSWTTHGSNYGQKILSAQGWKPGDYLGAQEANHSDHYTAANASHIRVLLREENLGLGAQIGKGNAETFGLNLFSGVLGRLNGKSDLEVEKQQSALRDAELKTYHANKHGFLNFVRGGLLVGDKIEPIEQQESIVTKHKRDHSDGHVIAKSKAKKNKIQKESVEANAIAEKGSQPKSFQKEEVDRSRKRKTRKVDQPTSTFAPPVARSMASPKDVAGSQGSSNLSTDERAMKRSKKVSKKTKTLGEAPESSVDDVGPDKLRRREERRARKEDRRKRKEDRRRLKSSMERLGQKNATCPQSKGIDGAALHSNPHAVRRRYIDSKRMASMNPQSMKEIFMLQAPA